MTSCAPGVGYVGQPVPRVNDSPLLRGDARFLDDVALPGLLHAVIVRSTAAHARLVRFDARAARERRGVVAVLTPEDIAAATRPLRCTWVLAGQRQEASPVVDLDIRYVGQPLAVIVARSPASAVDALAGVDLDYEERPAVVDVERALRGEPALLYADIPQNLVLELRVGSPTDVVERAIASAPHLIERAFRIQRQAGMPLEPRGVVAVPDPATRGLTLWTSTQATHQVRGELAEVLGLPFALVRVIAPCVGGGFGPKDHLYPDEVAVCVAARRVGAPVKWVEQRSEHTVATVHARDQLHRARLALDDDGRFLALDAQIVTDLGAQCSNVGAGPAFTTAALLEGPYHFGAAGATVLGVVTNKTPVGAYRGFGQAEAAWSRERLVDLAAAELGLDPVELRRRNMIRPDELPFTTHSGQSYDSGDYIAALDRAGELIAASGAPPADGRRRGTGLASYVQFAGSATTVERNINFRVPGAESVVLRMAPDGTVELVTGLCPHGQGLETSLAQLAADGLGIPIADVVVVWGDTAVTPYSAGTMASRSLMLGGGATIRAAAKLRARLLDLAAWRLECSSDDLEIAGRAVHVRGSPSLAVPIHDLSTAAWLGWGLPPGTDPGLEERAVFDPEDCVYSYGTHAAAVAVDLDTGQIEVERYAVVHDCGVTVNPQIVEGQVHGAVAQGIGGALFERIVYGDDGQPTTVTLVDYGLPSACEVPSIVVERLEHPTPRVPGGMKGMAEGGVIPTAAAIANAVANAAPEIAHLITETPLDPERVRQWVLRAQTETAQTATAQTETAQTETVQTETRPADRGDDS